MKRDLSSIGTTDLGVALARVRNRVVAPPWSKSFAASGAIADALGAFDDVDHAGLAAVLEAVLAERGTPRPAPEVVWTGPEPVVSSARDTAAVVRGMFANAETDVLVSCFSLDVATEARSLFEPLHDVMKQRNVKATIFFDLEWCSKAAKCSRSEATRASVFIDLYWPFDGPRPRLAYDPRALHPHLNSSLHAKVVVVDQRQVLVGSANLTDRGQTRNVELGVRLEDPMLASRIYAHWMGALAAGKFSFCS